MPSEFIYNGKYSYRDLHMLISSPPAVPFPKRRRTFITIGGVSGDFCEDLRAYENFTRTYTVSVMGNSRDELFRRISDIKSALLTVGEYLPLRDSYDPEYFYFAVCTEISDFKISCGKYASGSITFSCKPFAYRFRDYSKELSFSDDFTLTNRENIPAKPIIIAVGDLNADESSFPVETYITINGKKYNFGFNTAFGIAIDCEYEFAYHYMNGENMSSFLKFYNFPELVPGQNSISFPKDNITKIYIRPRWRKL